MRLIDADALPKLLDAEYKQTMKLIWEGEKHLDNLAEGFAEALHIAKYIATTVDAVPVVHGRWLCDGDFVICSQCEAEMNQKNSLGVDNFKNYCPNCGAKMDGGDGDAAD